MRELLRTLILFLITSPAFAGSIEVAPTTINVPPSSHSTVIHITNHGTEPAFAQIEAYDWKQDDAGDQLAQSHALMISPPMARLLPGQQQTVRVMIDSDAPTGDERTFRLIVSELPDTTMNTTDGVQVLLQFVLPVFVQGAAKSPPKLEWQTARDADGVVLTAHNAGARHLKLSDISITSADGQEIAVSGDTFNYVLAGASHTWKVPGAKLADGKPFAIKARDETDGMLNAPAVIAP